MSERNNGGHGSGHDGDGSGGSDGSGHGTVTKPSDDGSGHGRGHDGDGSGGHDSDGGGGEDDNDDAWLPVPTPITIAIAQNHPPFIADGFFPRYAAGGMRAPTLLTDSRRAAIPAGLGLLPQSLWRPVEWDLTTIQAWAAASRTHSPCHSRCYDHVDPRLDAPCLVHCGQRPADRVRAQNARGPFH